MSKLRKVFNKDGSVRKLIYPNGTRRYWWAGAETDFDFYWHTVNEKRQRDKLGRTNRARMYVGVDPAAGITASVGSNGAASFIRWGNVASPSEPMPAFSAPSVFRINTSAVEGEPVIGAYVGVIRYMNGESVYGVMNSRNDPETTLVGIIIHRHRNVDFRTGEETDTLDIRIIEGG